MSQEAWATVATAIIIVANGIVSWYHRERIKHEVRRMPAMQFDISVVIDPTGKAEPTVTVRRSSATD